MNTHFDFSDKVAVVTGGSSGIGKATVLAFSNAGARIISLDVSPPPSDQGAFRNVLWKNVDVSIEKEVRLAISAALGELGQSEIHILVNNAGIEFNTVGNLINMPADMLRRIIDVNLYGYINCARSVVPYMQAGARIVNISSIQGLAAHLPGTSYQVTKAGILGLTRALAVELATQGITVNAVAPGAIATEGMGAVRSEETNILDPYRKRIPLGRRGKPEEVAAPILFLCSDLASYVTGITLTVDGGYLTNITPDFGAPTRIVKDDPDHT